MLFIDFSSALDLPCLVLFLNFPIPFIVFTLLLSCLVLFAKHFLTIFGKVLYKYNVFFILIVTKLIQF